ncbi:unnamed protein product [Calypogeia fissa]
MGIPSGYRAAERRMKTAIAILALLALAGASGQPYDDDLTYINNQSSKRIAATTYYHFNAVSQFVDRPLDPGVWGESTQTLSNMSVVVLHALNSKLSVFC